MNTELWVDAGPQGVSAFIVQTDKNNKNIRHLVSCASRTFTKSECNYSQVEKESFACVWAILHFHIYLFGSKFTLVTDNRAASIIFDKQLDSNRKTPLRIQVWRSKLTQYNFDTKLIEGVNNIADYLSRCLIQSQRSNQTCYIKALIAETEMHLTDSILRNINEDLRVDTLIKETNKDPILSDIKSCLINKKPLKRSKENDQYRSHFEDMSIDANGLLMRGDQVVIPKSLWQQVIEMAHRGHLGAASCKRLVKSYYFIPQVNKLIDKYVGTCKACEVNSDYSNFNPVIASEMPKEKWRSNRS